MKRNGWLAAVLGLSLCACAPTTPYFDAHFGNAVNAAKAQQTLNPYAWKNQDPVFGIDGTAAKESMDRYHNSFKEPPPSFDIFFGSTGTAR